MAPREKVRKSVAEKKKESRAYRRDFMRVVIFFADFVRSVAGLFVRFMSQDDFLQRYRTVKVGARRRLPINCGSMANPEGCGKPKEYAVQPGQRRVISRPTPKTSRIDWSQQRMQKIAEEPRKKRRSRRWSRWARRDGDVKIATPEVIRHQRMPEVRIARRGLALQREVRDR